MTNALSEIDFPQATDDQWRDIAIKALKGADSERKLVSKTSDGIRIEPLYSKSSRQTVGEWKASGAKPWRIMQRMDHPDPESANRLALLDLEGGADALTLSWNGALAARGFGLECETLRDLDLALDGISLDLIELRLDPAPQGRINAALIAALAERRKLDPSLLKIDFGLDPLHGLAGQGSFSASWADISTGLSDCVHTLSQKGFQGPFLTADARPYHEAGASQAQELASALAILTTYLRALERGGHTLENARDALSCILVADEDQFLTIAKFRAMRALWSRIESACGLVTKPLKIHAETAWRSMTKRDPWVNVLRSTVATCAAGIGGADSVTVLPLTSALGLSDAFGRRLARNTQLVLLEEAHLWRVIDPSAGSGGLETLTSQLCEQAWSLFQVLEKQAQSDTPGIVFALSTGMWQAQILQTHAARMRDVETRKIAITGTSEFPNITEKPVSVLDTKPKFNSEMLIETEDQARTFKVMLEGMSEGFKRKSFLTKPDVSRLKAEKLISHRLAEPFEKLRDRSDEILAQKGVRPSIFFANLGTRAHFGARAGFAKNLFEAGGLETVDSDGYLDAAGKTDFAALTEAFKKTGAFIACLCGTDDAYEAEGRTCVAALKAAGCHTIIQAGRAIPERVDLAAEGVNTYIYVGCNLIETLQDLLLREE